MWETTFLFQTSAKTTWREHLHEVGWCCIAMPGEISYQSHWMESPLRMGVPYHLISSSKNTTGKDIERTNTQVPLFKCFILLEGIPVKGYHNPFSHLHPLSKIAQPGFLRLHFMFKFLFFAFFHARGLIISRAFLAKKMKMLEIMGT